MPQLRIEISSEASCSFDQVLDWIANSDFSTGTSDLAACLCGAQAKTRTVAGQLSCSQLRLLSTTT